MYVYMVLPQLVENQNIWTWFSSTMPLIWVHNGALFSRFAIDWYIIVNEFR